MAKIKLTENQLRDMILEAIGNVKKTNKPEPKKVTVKLSEIRQIVESVLKEYKYPGTEQFTIESDFETNKNYIPFRIVAEIERDDNGTQITDYKIDDLESFSPEEQDELQEYINKYIDEIAEKIRSEADEFESEQY
jgi:hypothetical protein